MTYRCPFRSVKLRLCESFCSLQCSQIPGIFKVCIESKATYTNHKILSTATIFVSFHFDRTQTKIVFSKLSINHNHAIMQYPITRITARRRLKTQPSSEDECHYEQTTLVYIHLTANVLKPYHSNATYLLNTAVFDYRSQPELFS